MLKLFYAFLFVFQYLFQLIRSNFHIAYITLSPASEIKYGFIEVPLQIQSDFGLLLFSNLVSMTPGSLVTNIDHHRSVATLHIVYSNDVNEIFDEVQIIQKNIKRITG